MSICDLKSYEIVQSRDLSDLSSKERFCVIRRAEQEFFLWK